MRNFKVTVNIKTWSKIQRDIYNIHVYVFTNYRTNGVNTKGNISTDTLVPSLYGGCYAGVAECIGIWQNTADTLDGLGRVKGCSRPYYN